MKFELLIMNIAAQWQMYRTICFNILSQCVVYFNIFKIKSLERKITLIILPITSFYYTPKTKATATHSTEPVNWGRQGLEDMSVYY